MRAKKIFVLMIVFSIFIGCKAKSKEPKVIKSTDGTFQVLVPGGWSDEKGLNDNADLQAGHRSSQMFVIVLGEGKQDLEEGMTVDQHSEITRNSLLAGVKSPAISEEKRLTIDGKPALQFEIRATVDHIKIIYLHTTVEALNNFYQILAWTVPSQWEKNKDTLMKVTEKFHEL